MKRHQLVKLKVQSLLSFTVHLFLALPEALIVFGLFSTKVYHKERLKHLKPPFLIVSNHLSLVDSWFGNFGVGFPQFYWKPWFFPWSVAEATNYFRGLLGVFIWLSRAIPIKRGGTPIEQALTLEKIEAVLEMGEGVYVFPEGTRSRTGRMGKSTPGVGRVYRQVPDCTLLPIYLRGAENVLPIGAKFIRFFKKVDVVIGEPVKLTCEAEGLHASKLMAEKIYNILLEMEKDYFASDQYRSKEIMAEKA
jgi:1-acyl-sn-glycerol-3-phosphate acyltransferase